MTIEKHLARTGFEPATSSKYGNAEAFGTGALPLS